MNKASLISFLGESRLIYRAASLVGPSHFPGLEGGKTESKMCNPGSQLFLPALVQRRKQNSDSNNSGNDNNVRHILVI